MKRAAPLFSKKFLRNAAIVLVIAVVAYVVMYGVKEGFQGAGRPTRGASPSPSSQGTPAARLYPLKKDTDGYYYVDLTKTADKQVTIPKSDFTRTSDIKKIIFEYYGPARNKTGDSFIEYDTAKIDDKYTYNYRDSQNVPPNATFKHKADGVFVQIGDPLTPSHIKVDNPDKMNIRTVNNDIFISRLTTTNMNILNINKTKNGGHIRIKVE